MTASEAASISAPVFPPATANPDFPRMEEEVLEHWRKERTFERSVASREGAARRDFVFYDGPPFATGTPHYGHLLASYIKDTVPRFWTMKGYRVERRFGWDCHGLPVEMEVQKELGLATQKDLLDFGVNRFNESCRSIVLKYTEDWRRTIGRIGRWVDFDRDYKTMDPTFMESVWWVFRKLWDQGLVYEGHRVMPYSWKCGTPLSNFEANLNYQDVQDPSITVRMKAEGDPNTWFLAWTTTPWTLPSNLALCVHPTLAYVQVEDATSGAEYILAESRLSSYYKKESEYRVKRRFPGRELEGRRYEPLFPYFAERRAKGAFRVLADTYVTDDSGTGVVHTAPAFGEDDLRVCSAAGIELVDPVDVDGNFTSQVPDFAGRNIKEADRDIVKKLKAEQKLVHHSTIDHSYPFCWRTDTPLLYKAVATWFVKVAAIKDRLVAINKRIRWVPDWVGDRRFGNWLEDARDWSISRNRYWGSCIPIWRCGGCRHTVCVGSTDELARLSGVRLTDLHKHHVDAVTWPCPACAKGTLSRIPEVFDCWFESGAMPYGQVHYPFENKEWFDQNFPAHFIAEGLDQTRGWFYTLLVLSTALFDKPAFQNCVVNGLVLAADGKKMSKRLKNYTAPEKILDEFGSDALRFFMLSSPVVEAQNLRMVDAEVKELVKAVLLPLWNAYRFFTEYANADGYRPRGLPDRPAHALDRYILSELALTVSRVGEEMEAYRVSRACRVASDFLETMNNWYIRRSRRRFWKTENDRDKLEAFETLYHVLVTYSRVLAPFLPFLAERVHRNLTGADSVHLADWPRVEPAHVDRDLSEVVRAARTVVSLGHQIRAERRLKTRTPLSVVKVGGVAERVLAENREAILEELNVKDLESLPDPSKVARKVLKPKGNVLGPRLKGALQEVFRLARSGEFTEIEDGRIQCGSAVLERGEYDMVYEAVSGYACAGQGKILVLLDLEVTDALRREGVAREIVRALQNLRKEAGYAVSDRIHAFVETENEEVRAAGREFASYICREVLAVELADRRGTARWDQAVDVDLDGVTIQIGVLRR